MYWFTTVYNHAYAWWNSVTKTANLVSITGNLEMVLSGWESWFRSRLCVYHTGHWVHPLKPQKQKVGGERFTTFFLVMYTWDCCKIWPSLCALPITGWHLGLPGASQVAASYTSCSHSWQLSCRYCLGCSTHLRGTAGWKGNAGIWLFSHLAYYMWVPFCSYRWEITWRIYFGLVQSIMAEKTPHTSPSAKHSISCGCVSL